jgi:hypothetical protein
MHVIHAEADSPLLIEEGWTRPQENIAEGILGGAAGGADTFLTTPSARLRWLCSFS